MLLEEAYEVLEAMTRYYETTHANVHRGVYTIAEEATREYEEARAKMARFLGAQDAAEVVFTKNVTEASNLFVQSWGRQNLKPGDVRTGVVKSLTKPSTSASTPSMGPGRPVRTRLATQMPACFAVSRSTRAGAPFCRPGSWPCGMPP